MVKTPKPLLDLLSLSSLALTADALSKIAAECASTRFREAMRTIRPYLTKDTLPAEGDEASESDRERAKAIASALLALEACAKALTAKTEAETEAKTEAKA